MRHLLVLLFVCITAHAGKIPLKMDGSTEAGPDKKKGKESYSSLEDLKLRKRFGLGVSAGGPLALFGAEADVNLTEDVSLSAGLGTGIDYSTFMVKARYFLLGEWVSPYIGGGVARWWTDSLKDSRVSPAVLANKFLRPGEGGVNGFSAWIVYPCIGVQFMSRMGFEVFAEVHYLFRLFSMSNGTYAGMGMHWYF